MVVRSGKDIKIPNLIPKDQKIKGKSPNLLPHLTITAILYIADTDTHTPKVIHILLYRKSTSFPTALLLYFSPFFLNIHFLVLFMCDDCVFV